VKTVAIWKPGIRSDLLAALSVVLYLLLQPERAYAESVDTAAYSRQVVYVIKPSETCAAIRRFDEPHYVVFNSKSDPRAQIAVFMAGTGGKPAAAAQLLSVIAGQSYRVIGLEYNNTPAVVEICAHNPAPNCSGDFRRRRIFADAVSVMVDNSVAESIVYRLAKLLEYLDRQHPAEGWGGYLVDGHPDWSRIVVSGFSQGAGMAAYIAKRKLVARVILFSGPWDYSATSRTLAPWLAEPSATPPQRWFAEYHELEKTAARIGQAYVALRIPANHIQVFDLGLPADGSLSRGSNPYHLSTIRAASYAPQWQLLFGRAP
jgi:predicted esterase